MLLIKTRRKKMSCRRVSFNVANGLDSAVRVLTTLRRKNFIVKEFSMKEIDGLSRLEIVVDDRSKLGMDQAILYVKRLVDVSDIVEVA
jgi:acetolactate synthase small subunit